jgi:cytochrome c peroxidase
VTPDMGSYIHHAQPFAFVPTELLGLEVFLAEPNPALPPSPAGGVGNCISCHPAPDFTDHLFHSTGAAQLEYDNVHGDGAFLALSVPELAARSANPFAYLPPSVANPTAQGRFRSAPTADDASLADLGLWNVYANADIPNPQAALQGVLCPSPQGTTDCSAGALLPKTLGLFKTPGLRDLDDSAPYLHNGTANDLAAVLTQYQKVSGLQRAGTLRNGDGRLAGMSLAPGDIAELEAFLHSLAEDYQ